jgi:hypothetical protein
MAGKKIMYGFQPIVPLTLGYLHPAQYTRAAYTRAGKLIPVVTI